MSQIDVDRSESTWISIADTRRSTFSSHPWSVSGGVANSLKERLDRHAIRLEHIATSIGFASFTGTDGAFTAPREYFHRRGVQPELVRGFVFGEALRDWSYNGERVALVPYDHEQIPLDYVSDSSWGRHLWPFRSTIGGVRSFGGKTRIECGDNWWTWYLTGRSPREHEVFPRPKSRYRSPAFEQSVATQTSMQTSNGSPQSRSRYQSPCLRCHHFVFDRGGKVFSQTAQVIKLPPGDSEANHLALTGLLNSSVACFWMKQVCHDKGGGGAWERRFEHGATALQRLPLTEKRPLQVATELDLLAAARHVPPARAIG